MNIDPQIKTLFDSLPKDHPLTPQMQNAMADVSAAGQQFAERRRELAKLVRKGRMTELSRREALDAALAGGDGLAWARAKAPVARAREKTKAKRAALVVKDHDYAAVDSLAALAKVLVAESRDKENREHLLDLNPQARMAKALAGDARILESAMRVSPELAGFDELPPGVADQVKARYIEQTYPNKITEIEAEEAVIGVAEAAVGMVYNNMRDVADHLPPHEFSERMQVIESKVAAPTEAPKAPPEVERAKPTASESAEEILQRFRTSPEMQEIDRRLDAQIDAIMKGATV
jgi:hypothetical protein